MIKYLLPLFFIFLPACVAAQSKTTFEKNLKADWRIYEKGKYRLLEDVNDLKNTLYINIEANKFPGGHLSVYSGRSFFIFFNGQLAGEHVGKKLFSLDSLTRSYNTPSFIIAVYQRSINPNNLKTSIITTQVKESIAQGVLLKPATYFKDFVILSGLSIMLLFLLIVKLNPKLSADYFSIVKIFSLREADDAQSNARLASSSNLQFYIVCSLLLGFYMMIIINHLPDEYALPLYFRGSSFWSSLWNWVRFSAIVLGIFFIKIFLVYTLTRLFGLRGLARIHFFNWVRLLLIVFGTSSVVLFVYYISRGQSPDFFIIFLSLVIGTFVAWIFIVFLKLNGKTEHSMFHLFSYICATEIIPLLITIKVLFQ